MIASKININIKAINNMLGWFHNKYLVGFLWPPNLQIENSKIIKMIFFLLHHLAQHPIITIHPISYNASSPTLKEKFGGLVFTP